MTGTGFPFFLYLFNNVYMRIPSIKILYEDDDVLVINKPAGIAVHDDVEGRQSNTIADWIMAKYPEMKDVGNKDNRQSEKSGDEEAVDQDDDTYQFNRPGIVHRLDKDTSGVLVLAKNEKAYKFLKEQFQNRTIKKVYLAIVYGRMRRDADIIDRPIGRNRADFRAKATGASARGELKNAVTYYKVLDRFDGYSLVELRPKTGRTHQLRAHLKSINYPIVCDNTYAPNKPCLEGLKRQALHALSIEFRLFGGKEIKVEAPTPPDFKRGLANLKQL
jgi:23S rRNA pseudouridine1911/1915/1917 synthase